MCRALLQVTLRHQDVARGCSFESREGGFRLLPHRFGYQLVCEDPSRGAELMHPEASCGAGKAVGEAVGLGHCARTAPLGALEGVVDGVETGWKAAEEVPSGFGERSVERVGRLVVVGMRQVGDSCYNTRVDVPRRRRVLVIEDDEDVRQVCGLALGRKKGWQVELAADGEEGLRKAVETRPTVILLDVLMPGVDGLVVLSMLKATSATKAIPVVMMSAQLTAADRERCLALGASKVVEKPIDLFTLADHLASVAHS